MTDREKTLADALTNANIDKSKIELYKKLAEPISIPWFSIEVAKLIEEREK